MKFSALLLVSFALVACARNPYREFYKPIADIATVPEPLVLEPGRDPKIYSSKNLDRDTKDLRSKHYFLIGYSSFAGEPTDDALAVEQARDLGATLVLVDSEQAGTATARRAVFVPTTSTTRGSDGYTSTTYSHTVIPTTTQYSVYDQTARFFVKSTKKPKIGLWLQDLTLEQRSKLQRNTGVFVTLVGEDSPAFFANALPDDVLIAVKGVPVKNTQDAGEELRRASGAGGPCPIEIIRDGKSMTLTLQLNAATAKTP